MTLLLQFDAAAENRPLNYEPTPVLMVHPGGPPEIVAKRALSRAASVDSTVRSFTHDKWVHVQRGEEWVSVGRLLKSGAYKQKYRRIVTTTGLTLVVDRNSVVRRGRDANRRSFYGSVVRVADEP